MSIEKNQNMSRGSKGGSCWFAKESKSFEISVENADGKLHGIIEVKVSPRGLGSMTSI